MTKLISKEQFQERLENKRESLLEQKRKSIEEEISIILRRIDMEKLSEEDQLKIRESAKNIAEQKDYNEDYKLKILNNIQKSAEENHFGEEIDKNEGLDIFSDITNDIVYKRMVKEGDLENIKLFLERKLDVETYLGYLTDEEIKDLGIEGMYLLIKKMKEEGDNIENVDTSVNNPEEESKSVIINENIINDVKETTSTEEGKILSETNLESIRNAVNHYMEHGIIIYNAKNVDDIINKIKYKIYRKSGISTKNWGKEDFLNNNNGIEIEKADIPTQYEAGDKFQVYCASALTSGFITVEIKGKENDNVNDEDNVNTEDNINTEDNGEIVQLHLSKSVIDELQTVKTDIENIFNHDEFLINDFVNSFINLRGIGFKSLIEEYRRGLPLQEYYKNSGWNDLYKYLTDMYFEKYEGIAEITRKLGKIITNLQQQSLLCFEEIKKILLKK